MRDVMPGGAVLWITGLPSAGKTTLARGVVDALRARGHVTVWLDSDDLRGVLTPSPSYTDAERDAFYRVVEHLAELAAAGGAVAVISATGSKRAYRRALRQRVPSFVEVWLTCAEPERLRRDMKGLYERARGGEIPNLPGSGGIYEAPEHADLVIDTTHKIPSTVLDVTMRWLDAHRWTARVPDRIIDAEPGSAA